MSLDKSLLKRLMTEIVRFQMIFLCLFSMSTTSIADEIVLIADDWCPFNCNLSDDNHGFLIDVAEYSLERKGHSVRYMQAPWQRSIREVMRNQYQGLVGPTIADAPELIFPKKPLHVVKHAFYVLTKSNWKYTGIKSLESVNLGVINNYYYSDEINAYIDANKNDKSKITMISDDIAIGLLVSLLRRNRIDTFIDVRGVVQHYFSTQEENLHIKEAGDGPSQDIYIGFSPNNPKSQSYADALDEGMAELRKSGKLKQLYKKYNLGKKSN